MTAFKEAAHGVASWRIPLAGRDSDYSEVFRHRHRGELVSRNIHVEPAPRVPDYEELARLVGRPRLPKDSAQPSQIDAGQQRRTVPER
jgi:hypothetical protein